jgi:hypothetical protein
VCVIYSIEVVGLIGVCHIEVVGLIHSIQLQYGVGLLHRGGGVGV